MKQEMTEQGKFNSQSAEDSRQEHHGECHHGDHGHHIEPIKINKFCYRLAQFVTGFVSKFIFKRKFIRNEIKGKKGPFVVIANHQAAYDFVNLFGATRTPMHFVISESFYRTLPIKGFLDKLGVIPKQQFQTTLKDLRKMKSVIDDGNILVIYPAGLMCEDGLSTPIPVATYQFLKWIKADVYVARTAGTYFSMPKWSKGIRAGRTTLDIYKLFSKEELEALDAVAVKERAEEAMLFDAYREQEKMQVKYKRGDDIQGLEHVLYICPHCLAEHSITVKDKSVICCEKCGYAQRSDKYGFLHKCSEVGEEIRYVSDWSRFVQQTVRERVGDGSSVEIKAEVTVHTVEPEKKKFVESGEAEITLTKDAFRIVGKISGEDVDLTVPVASFASVPFSPGKYIEIQHEEDIFRCVPKDNRKVAEFVNTVKILYEIHSKAHEHV